MSTLTAFCDLQFAAISYDIAVYLARAKVEQEIQGCDRLHVVLVPKEDGVGGFGRDWGGYDEHETRWRLWHLVMGLCPLARATVTLAASRAQAKHLEQLAPTWWPYGKAHFMAPLVERARAGGRIPKLEATPAARRHIAAWLANEERPVVTITTRRHAFGPTRNTDPIAWREFEDWLDGHGYAVVHLEDTTRALAQGRGHAELDADLRLALYERAAMNCIGQNGPVGMLWLSNAPWLWFETQENDPSLPEVWGHHGMKRGEQLPWARADQRVTYRPDTSENLVEEFRAWAKC